jgi:cardiolipin synthase C
MQANDGELIKERLARLFVPVEKVEFVSDNPGKNKGFFLWGGGKVTRRIRKFMKATEESLILQSPYLVLNTGERRSFRKLRRKHPEATVTVSTNSFAATDNTLAYSANFKLRPSYIQNLGFRIYELKPRPANFESLLPNHADLERRGKKKGERRAPFICIHAKTFVRDDRYAFVGTYNIDPRSAHLNSEVGLFIEDEALAKTLKQEIMARTDPGSSWVIARRETPLANVNYLIEGISGLSPVDIWPLRNTSSFELLPDKKPLDPYHEDFYSHYRDVGNFPGTSGITAKEITTRLYKVLGAIAIPMI